MSAQDYTPAQQQVAEYLSQMTREMQTIAKANGFETLSYLLDIATLEAMSLNGDEGIGHIPDELLRQVVANSRIEQQAAQ